MYGRKISFSEPKVILKYMVNYIRYYEETDCRAAFLELKQHQGVP
jgi:hypothetical protein